MAPQRSDPLPTGAQSNVDVPHHDTRSADTDPFNVTFVLDDALGVLKGAVRDGLRFASWGERQALGLLRARLEATKPVASSTSEPQDDIATVVNTKMNDLLSRAVDQSSMSSRLDIFHKIVDRIVPDEARIISALSDGAVEPLINIYARTRGGLGGELILENMSLVGRTANLALPVLTPIYVGHLMSMGLVETGPENPELKDQYEILAADTSVLEAIKHAGRGPLPARVEKRVLRISDFGRDLWATANNQQVTE